MESLIKQQPRASSFTKELLVLKLRGTAFIKAKPTQTKMMSLSGVGRGDLITFVLPEHISCYGYTFGHSHSKSQMHCQGGLDWSGVRDQKVPELAQNGVRARSGQDGVTSVTSKFIAWVPHCCQGAEANSSLTSCSCGPKSDYHASFHRRQRVEWKPGVNLLS